MTNQTALINSGELNELNAISAILAGGLSQNVEAALELPVEVAQALAEARQQMENLPEVIASLHQAVDSFYTVSEALYRMIALADQASGAELSSEERVLLNDEFANLAKVVAADAGRHYYAGPQLNLLSQVQALSAARIIRYMEPVIENTGREIMAQRDLIHEVVAETIKFLTIITDCYAESEGAAILRPLLASASSHSLELRTIRSNLH